MPSTASKYGPRGYRGAQYTVNGTLPRYLWYKAFWHLWYRLQAFQILAVGGGYLDWNRLLSDYYFCMNGRGAGPRHPLVFLGRYDNALEVVDFVTQYAAIRWARVSSF